MCKQYQSTKTSLRERLVQKSRIAFWAVMALVLSTTLAGLYSPLAHAGVYGSNQDLYIELVVSDTEILPPDTAAGNYTTDTTYDMISRSLADNWLIITIIALVTIGLAILVVYLVRRYLKKTGISLNTQSSIQSNSQPANSSQPINIELDPNTEIVNVAKLLKNHKAKRILLQITPVLALALVALSASWAIIQSYAATLSLASDTDAICVPAQAPGSCIKFSDDLSDEGEENSAQNPLYINLVRSSSTGTIDLTGQTKVLLQNVKGVSGVPGNDVNVTGSMYFGAHLAQALPGGGKISNVKLSDSSTLTTGQPLEVIRTSAGTYAYSGDIEVSLTVDKSIANGNYPIKISTILVPDTMQTFDKTLSVYADDIIPVDKNSSQDDRDNATIILLDNRDNKPYRIRKFTTHANNASATNTVVAWWWMIDNLAFDLLDSDGARNPYAPEYNPTASHINTGVGTTSDVQAQYITGGSLSASKGYFYNWCAATADTSSTCTDSASTTANLPMPNSICPVGTNSPWKLPKGDSDVNLNDFA